MPNDPQFAGASLPAQAEPARPLPPKKADSPRRDYYARLAARFLKDPLISPDAKLLRALLAAFADERTSRTFVSLSRIERLMRCGRKRRSAAQNELVAAGWLQLEHVRASGGRLGRLTYLLREPPPCGPPGSLQGTTGLRAALGCEPQAACEPPLGHFATVVGRQS